MKEGKSVSEQAICSRAAKPTACLELQGAGETLPRELPGNPVLHQQSRGPPVTPYPKPVATAPGAHSPAFGNYLSNSFQMSDNRITSTLVQM